MAHLIGYTGFVLLAALVLWIGIAGRKASARRQTLPPEERERLEHEDAVWLQRYGF